MVLVENIHEDAERDGLTQTAIQTDTELALRQAGIQVYNEEEWLETESMPLLRVGVHPVKRDNMYAYSLSLKVNQLVFLMTGEPVPATTYFMNRSTGSVGSSNLRSVRDAIKDDVNIFINDWLATRPE